MSNSSSAPEQHISEKPTIGSRFKTLGPGLIVMAAFMGPGSVTTASVAGADYGFVVLWSVVFATVATIILQEMSARLGIVSRQGLGEALRSTFTHPLIKYPVIVLVILAIGVGGFSFATGNVTGSSQGMTILTGIPYEITIVVTVIIVAALLFMGRYKILERVLVTLVIVMSVTFLVTAIIVQPDVGEILKGLVVPSVPAGSLITLIGLIGSAVVPYNLFLHATTVQRKWPESIPTARALSESRFDTSVSISIGGLITAAIMATAASAFYTRGAGIDNAVEMSQQLEPVLGPAAESFFGLGFMAAGLTSAITAPLAAAYAVSGVLGWSNDPRGWRFRSLWMIVLAGGMIMAMTGVEPVSLIIVTQYAAGLSLPVLAVFLIVVMNRKKTLGKFTNGVLSNVLGALVVLGVAVLGALQILGLV